MFGHKIKYTHQIKALRVLHKGPQKGLKVPFVVPYTSFAEAKRAADIFLTKPRKNLILENLKIVDFD